MKKINPHITDFTFRYAGPGRYQVTYMDHTGKNWTRIVSDMRLIEDTKNTDNPKRSRLEDLKRNVKF